MSDRYVMVDGKGWDLKDCKKEIMKYTNEDNYHPIGVALDIIGKILEETEGDIKVNEELEQRIVDLEDEIFDLRQEIEDYEYEINKLEDEISCLNIEVFNLQDEIDVLQEQLSDRDYELGGC